MVALHKQGVAEIGHAHPAPQPSARPPEPAALVLVAHRGPVRFSAHAGRRTMRRNAGGLVTALESLVQELDRPVRWICAPASEQDRLVARTQPWTRFDTDESSCRVRMVDVDPDAHHDFYNVIANPLLWFVQHELYGGARPEIGVRELRAWRDGYIAVNETFASALSDFDNVPRGATVMLHDYHFYLVPGMLRAARPDVFIHHFTHIPWPPPDAWEGLLPTMYEAIFRGLLGADIVGFHTARHVRNFLRGCEELLGLPVDFVRGTVAFEGRGVAVHHYPISINVDALETLASTPPVATRAQELADDRTGKLVLRVDRADPSKNIVRGFEAFRHLLRRHPELHGRVSFLALLQRTREDVAEYVDYMERINRIVAAVNHEFSAGGWLPIDLRLVDDLDLAVAAYKSFDVLMVNPIADGMNLVVKEAAIVNETDGVIILSERAGAHAELGAAVIGVNPFDVEEQAEALYDALTMPPDLRRRRSAVVADIVRNNNMNKWLRHQLHDIELARATSALHSSD